MWEFSLNVKTEKTEVAEFLFENIKKNCLYMQGIVTLHEENNMTSILVAVDDDFSQEATTVLERLITQVIWTYFYFVFVD